MGATIIYVADDMYVINGEPLDERSERLDEVVTRASVKDRLYYADMIGMAIGLSFSGSVEQLVDDVGIGDRHRLAHFGAGVVARQHTSKTYEAHERLSVPACRSFAPLLDELQLFFWIVDQGAEVRLGLLVKLSFEDASDLLLDDSRAVVEDVYERLVFPMEVAHEMLGAHRKVEDRLKVDDLGKG